MKRWHFYGWFGYRDDSDMPYAWCRTPFGVVAVFPPTEEFPTSVGVTLERADKSSRSWTIYRKGRVGIGLMSDRVEVPT